MFQENLPPSHELLKQETPERKVRIAQRDLFLLAESLNTMTPKELKEIVAAPLKKTELQIKDPKTYENPAVKAELNKIRVKALAYQYEDGSIWINKRFKAIESDPKLQGDEKTKANKIKNNLNILSLVKKEWEEMKKETQDFEKLGRLDILIEEANKKIQEKLPESIYIDKEDLDNILRDFTLSQDKNRARNALKNFISNCEIKVKDKKLDKNQIKQITKLKNDALGYLITI